jgi:hypothetical protein
MKWESDAKRHWERWCRLRHVPLPPPQPKPAPPESDDAGRERIPEEKPNE